MLRIAGWFSGIFYLILGLFLEAIVLGVLFCELFGRQQLPAEWVVFGIFSLVPVGYGYNILWRLSLPAKELDPPTSADAANDAELAAIIERLKTKQLDQPK